MRINAVAMQAAVLALILQLLPAGRVIGETDRFRQHIVMDEQGFGIEAFRVLVPEGWRLDGGLR